MNSSGASLTDTTTPALVGYKTAYLEVKTARGGVEVEAARFRGLAHGVPYQTQSLAVCANGYTHKPPVEWCRCGSYAVKEREAILFKNFPGAQLSNDSCLLTVWLHGDVIEGAKGYRAERQTIAHVELNPRCDHRDCGERAVGLEVSSEVSEYDVDGEWRRVQARCAEHGGEISPSYISALLGTEVVWGDYIEWGMAAESSHPRPSLRGMFDLFGGAKPRKEAKLIAIVAVMLAVFGVYLYHFHAWEGGSSQILAYLGVGVMHIPLLGVAAAGMRRAVGRSVAMMQRGAVRNWQALVIITMFGGMVVLGMGSAQLRTEVRAAEVAGNALLEEASALIRSIPRPGEYITAQNAEGLVASAYREHNYIENPSSITNRDVASGGDRRAEAGQREFWMQAGAEAGKEGVVGVEVIGDRIVMTTLSEGGDCYHWGLDAAGTVVWRAASPRFGVEATAPCGYEPARTTWFENTGPGKVATTE